MISSPTKLLIADDHPVILHGVKAITDGVPNIEILDMVSDLSSLPKKIQLLRPHIILLDINFLNQNALDILSDLVKQNPACHFVMFTSYNDPYLVRLAMDKGAKGYMLKDVQRKEFLLAIEKILVGETYITKDVDVKNNLSANTYLPQNHLEKLLTLSKRELEIAKHKVEGKTSVRIGEDLFISPHTVRTHLKNIMKKLEINNSVELANIISNELNIVA